MRYITGKKEKLQAQVELYTQRAQNLQARQKKWRDKALIYEDKLSAIDKRMKKLEKQKQIYTSRLANSDKFRENTKNLITANRRKMEKAQKELK